MTRLPVATSWALLCLLATVSPSAAQSPTELVSALSSVLVSSASPSASAVVSSAESAASSAASVASSAVESASSAASSGVASVSSAASSGVASASSAVSSASAVVSESASSAVSAVSSGAASASDAVSSAVAATSAAASSVAGTGGITAALPSGTQAASVTVTRPVKTAVPSPTGSLDTPIEDQEIVPPQQQWCNGGENAPWCPGLLLQDVQLSRIFPDSKTFVDKPTINSTEATQAAFEALGENVTLGEITDFVNKNFKGEGQELTAVDIQGFNPSPAILDNVQNPIYKGFVSTVNGYWSNLIRETNESAVCGSPEGDSACASSLIPFNNTIVVPGGRYREIYYWDSFWVLEGLLKSELYDYANDLLQNFMDLIELYGFIPNGGRKYYLNRSQPPVFIQMLDAYVKQTGNTTILDRALLLASAEMEWWKVNRTIDVTSPYTNTSYRVAHYAVVNSAPRPEGYVEDIDVALGAQPPFNSTQRADIYAELASGAESGWDYSSRWTKEPLGNITDNSVPLRTLNVRSIIPVDLTSLLAGDHALLANLWELWLNSDVDQSAKSNYSWKPDYHRSEATEFTNAVLDLHWDPTKSFFYDFNLTSNERTEIYSPAGLWPLWQNITPPALENNDTEALKVFAGVHYLLDKYVGIPSVASLLTTGLNWDFPNSWPPHLYTSIKALDAITRVNPNASIWNSSISFADIPEGQFGVAESDLVEQPADTIGNTSVTIQEADGKPWPLALQIAYSKRYMQSAFCSWYSTGGSLEGVLSQLPLSDLNATGTYATDPSTGELPLGIMFEKFAVTDPDAAGGGGEYTVQTGFGWTNGVVLWLAGVYGEYLEAPTCPLIPIVENNATTSANGTTLFAGYRIPKGQ